MIKRGWMITDMDTALRNTIGSVAPFPKFVMNSLRQILMHKPETMPTTGFGTYQWEDGEVYTGHWLNGKQHGTGIMYYAPDGFSHMGEWCEGQPHGKGTVTWPDGSRFEGEWLKGRRIKGEHDDYA